MAFNAAGLSKWSPFNEVGPQLFGYVTKLDNIATVSTSTYFTPFADSFSQSLLPFPFNVGDTIQCTCSDGNVNLTVTAINPIATTEETTSIVIGPNSVNTAAIQNLAVTAGKIANATITTTQISASAAITGAQLSGSAGIIGTQLSGSAAILGSQLSATAGIVGTQLAANTLTATELALSVPQVISVPITSANFTTAYTAGLPIIAAAGTGTIINILSCTITFNYLTASYTAGGAIGLQYSTAAPVHAGGIAASATIAAANVTGLSAVGYETVAGALAINGAAGLVNAGIWLTVATQNFATGAGALTVNVVYNVLTV